MEEKETERHPFALTVIPIFYGFMALMSVLGASGQYILFSMFLPGYLSVVVVAIETTVLIFLTAGIFKRRALARSILIGYNIFAITDILFTLTFVNKEKLLEILKDASALEEYANINLLFCLILFIILRYVRSHKEYFTG
jgi:hypothetical protein